MKKINFTKPDFTKFKTKVTEEFREIRNDKKKLAIWITSAVTVAALIICAVMFVPGAIKGNASSASDTASSNKITAAQKSSTNTSTSKKKSKATATPTASTEASASPTPAATQSADKKDEKKDSKETAKESTPAKQNNPTAKSNTNQNSQNNKASTATANNNQKTTTKNNSNSQAKQKSCKVVNHPAVTHQETAYTTVHHDEVSHMESYVVTPAWDEQVQAGNLFVCSVCKQKFNSENDVYDHIENVHGSGNFTFEPTYQTAHHDAVMGQRKVVDKAAYDEKVPNGTYTVTDKQAWTETVCN